MFKSNRLGILANLTLAFLVSLAASVSLHLYKLFPIPVLFPIVGIFSLVIIWYFVYFCLQFILNLFEFRILPEKQRHSVDTSNMSLRPRKDVTDSL